MRLLGLGLLLGLSAAACSNPDIGKACAKNEDCGEGLLCDVHDGKGTCQGPHGHDGGEETAEDTGHATEDHATGSHDSEATGSSGGSTGGAEVGEACAVDDDCAGELVCHDEGGVKTCQESHEHVRP